MSSLFQNGKYRAVNSSCPTKQGYYVVNFISEPYTLQGNKTVNKKVFNAGEFIVNVVYLIMIKSSKNWYWGER